MTSQRSGMGREGREGLGITPRRARRIGRLTWRYGRGQEGRERSGVPPGVPGGVGRPSRWDGRGRNAFQEDQEGSGGPPGGLGGVGRPSHIEEGSGGEGDNGRLSQGLIGIWGPFRRAMRC